VWGDTRLPLPKGDGRPWRSAFTGETLAASDSGVPASELLGLFPVALLVREG
jgi:maltooligosyltrehalose synthase